MLLTNYHSFQSCTVHLPEIALPLQVECDHTGNLVVDYQHTTPMFEDPVGDRISKYWEYKYLIIDQNTKLNYLGT